MAWREEVDEALNDVLPMSEADALVLDLIKEKLDEYEGTMSKMRSVETKRIENLIKKEAGQV